MGGKYIMSAIVFMPIGYIYTPFKKLSGMPIQPAGARGVKGRIEIHPDLADGITDLSGFSHLILIYHFHSAGQSGLLVQPYLDDNKRGVFATRAPSRPNPIGLSLVRLTGIKNSILYIEDIDVLDHTPLIDIKPYIPDIDAVRLNENIKTGWYDNQLHDFATARSDDRFGKKTN
jgi:tRNA-Thr(GGU) m(6)t(6)A37 methyltransferase TsaA